MNCSKSKPNNTEHILLTHASATDQLWGWRRRLFLRWWRRPGSGSRASTHPSCSGSTPWKPRYTGGGARQKSLLCTHKKHLKYGLSEVTLQTAPVFITTCMYSTRYWFYVHCTVPCPVPVGAGRPLPRGRSGPSAQLAYWCWWFPSEPAVLNSAHTGR